MPAEGGGEGAEEKVKCILTSQTAMLKTGWPVAQVNSMQSRKDQAGVMTSELRELIRRNKLYENKTSNSIGSGTDGDGCKRAHPC
jgi:hypothetical protein